MNGNSLTLDQLIQRKWDCVSQVYALAQTQLQFAQQGDIDQVLRVVRAKQEWVSRLDQIEQFLAPHRRVAPEQRSWPSPAVKKLCEEQLAQCEAMLAETLKLEEEGLERLAEFRDQSAAQLQNTSQTGDAWQAYGPPPTSSSFPSTLSQLDLTSEG